MAQVRFFSPIDPPRGANRLIGELKEGLLCTDFNLFCCAVAFAKVGPFLRLASQIEAWRANKRKIWGIFGIDNKGTSLQALEFALASFDGVFITHNPIQTTFHPKIYFFKGPARARIYFGSHNFTVGGLETNFEAGVCIDLCLPQEKRLWSEGFSCWTNLLPGKCPNTKRLSRRLLKRLWDEGYLLDETVRRGSPGRPKKPAEGAIPPIFPCIPPKPPSSIKIPKKYKAEPKKARAVPIPPEVSSSYRALAIQIIPHHNGEIFLSKMALNQSPEFFGYPFTGRTVPKKASNPSYPQREPDPAVILSLFDSTGEMVERKLIPNLNMVYYERKSDIRITVSPDLARKIPPYSIMVMRLSTSSSEIDYECEIYFPGSSIYGAYLEECQENLPSGGKAVPRKMGWL